MSPVKSLTNGVCAICDEAFRPGNSVVEWGRSPWGDGEDFAHYHCADNWEPTDEQMCPSEWGPTITERLEAARRLK